MILLLLDPLTLGLLGLGLVLIGAGCALAAPTDPDPAWTRWQPATDPAGFCDLEPVEPACSES